MGARRGDVRITVTLPRHLAEIALELDPDNDAASLRELVRRYVELLEIGPVGAAQLLGLYRAQRAMAQAQINKSLAAPLDNQQE